MKKKKDQMRSSVEEESYNDDECRVCSVKSSIELFRPSLKGSGWKRCSGSSQLACNFCPRKIKTLCYSLNFCRDKLDPAEHTEERW